MDIDKILQDYEGWLYREARKLSSSGDLVDDLVQEGRVAMWKALQTFDAARGALPAWLTYKAKNRMLTCVTENLWEGTARKTGNNSLKVNPTPVVADTIVVHLKEDYSHSENLDLSYHSAEIVEAVNALTPKQREYVYFRFWRSMTGSDMVKEFGYNPNGLWAAKTSGAKARLKSKLAHLEAVL